MKKIILLLTAITITMACFSQEQQSAKPHNNEIGVDLTKLLSRFFNLKTSDTLNYFEPAFNINYKRYCPKFNLRFGIGYDVYNHKDEIPFYYNYSLSQTIDTTINLKSYSNTYKLRLGIEKTFSFSKKWELLYGLDLVFLYRDSKTQDFFNEAYYVDLTYTKGNDLIFGPSPFIGIKFNISERFSIFTESFYWFYYQKSAETVSRLYLFNSGTPIPDQTATKKGFYSYFTNPISIHCAIRF